MTSSDDTPTPPADPDPQARTMRILTGIAIGGIIAAIVLGVVIGGITGQGIALGLGGLSCVLGVCLAFYAVGRSEDRERAQRTEDR